MARHYRPVEGKTLQEFADAYEEATNELSRATIIEEKEIGPLQLLIYYEDPDEPNPEPEAPASDYDIRLADDGQYITVSIMVDKRYPERYCCECANYDWGRGCPYRSGHVRQMDRACPMFNVLIGRR